VLQSWQSAISINKKLAVVILHINWRLEKACTKVTEVSNRLRFVVFMIVQSSLYTMLTISAPYVDYFTTCITKFVNTCNIWHKFQCTSCKWRPPFWYRHISPLYFYFGLCYDSTRAYASPRNIVAVERFERSRQLASSCQDYYVCQFHHTALGVGEREFDSLAFLYTFFYLLSSYYITHFTNQVNTYSSQFIAIIRLKCHNLYSCNYSTFVVYSKRCLIGGL